MTSRTRIRPCSTSGITRRISPGATREDRPDAREFQGWIDEVAFFARALSGNEIEQMFKAGNAINPFEEAASNGS